MQIYCLYHSRDFNCQLGVRIEEGWPVWSRYPNSKVNSQENSIEFLLDLCPDFILLYMVCVQWLSKQVLYDLSTDPLSYLPSLIVKAWRN